MNELPLPYCKIILRILKITSKFQLDNILTIVPMSKLPRSLCCPGRHDGGTWYCGCKNKEEPAILELIQVDDGVIEERTFICNNLRLRSSAKALI